MTLEEFSGNEADNYEKFYESLDILVPLLESSPFLEGEKAGFSDYLLAGMFQFIRSINPKVYEKMVYHSPHPKLKEWAIRMDELFGGYLKNRKTC
jgi:glutathione S-transferase